MMISSRSIAILIFLGVAILAALLKRKTSSSRKLYLLRALFPSWQFFDKAGPTPILRYRLSSTAEFDSDWKEMPSPPTRTFTQFWWRNLLLNPSGQLHFACDSLVHQLIADAQSSDSPAHSFRTHPSYQLVRAWVESCLPKSAMHFQFRVDLATPELHQGKVTFTSEEIFLSATEKHLGFAGMIEP